MPIVSPSSFAPSRWFAQCDLQTIVSSTFRTVAKPNYARTRITTPDDDFIDVDVVSNESSHLAILCHGLEGSAYSPYMRGMVQAISAAGVDVAAMNFRGCSGEPNRKPHSYHSGSSEDLEDVIDYFLPRYESLSLVGFSLGGNIVLKYLGERSAHTPSALKSAIAISVPVELAGAAKRMAALRNTLYMQRFLRMLKEKLELKSRMFPKLIQLDDFSNIKTFEQFDDRYVAPFNGFQNAQDYYAKASSLPLLSQIRTPTLLINALDDPFLSPSCYPLEIARQSEYLFFDSPPHGGHVGFFRHPREQRYWSEECTVRFLVAQQSEFVTTSTVA